MEALLFDPNREIICDKQIKSNAKVKRFHVVVWGNFPAARDFAESDTYTTTRQRAVGNGSSSEIIGIISGTRNHRTVNHQRATYRSPRHRVNDHPPTSESSPRNHERSAAAILAILRQPRGLRPESTIRLSGKRDDS